MVERILVPHHARNVRAHFGPRGTTTHGTALSLRALVITTMAAAQVTVVGAGARADPTIVHKVSQWRVAPHVRTIRWSGRGRPLCRRGMHDNPRTWPRVACTVAHQFRACAAALAHGVLQHLPGLELLAAAACCSAAFPGIPRPHHAVGRRLSLTLVTFVVPCVDCLELQGLRGHQPVLR